MPVIDIHRPHTLGLQSARAAVEHVAKAIAGEYGVSHRWCGDELLFTRQGVNGRIVVACDEVSVRVELGMLLGMLKPAIEREIERQLDQHIV